MKLCNDCKHYMDEGGDAHSESMCARTEETSVVDESPIYATCHDERYGQIGVQDDYGDCGEEGKFWEPAQ